MVKFGTKVIWKGKKYIYVNILNDRGFLTPTEINRAKKRYMDAFVEDFFRKK